MRNLINIIEAADSSITDAWFADGFDTYKLPEKEHYEIAQRDGYMDPKDALESNGKPVPYQSGAYIMTGPKGEKYPISPARFAELKDDLGNGVCIPKKIPKVAKLADHDGFVTVDWGKGPQKLHYTTGNDYIVKHGPGNYGVVKKDIFAQTYAQGE